VAIPSSDRPDRGEKCIYIADDGTETIVGRDVCRGIDVERAIATDRPVLETKEVMY
jgi:hypothetical protein